MMRLLTLAAGLLLGLAGPALAHKASDGFLELTLAGAEIDGRIDLALRDVEQAIGLDADGDGAITWAELEARQADIAAYVAARLDLAADGAPCPVRPGALLVDHHSDGAYAVLRLAAACPAPPHRLAIGYHLLFDLDPLHRGLVQVSDGTGVHTAVLAPDAPELRLSVGGTPNLLSQILSYGRQGVWHIWIGFDHILFLLSLLLPAVLRRRDGRWRAVGTFREAAVEVLKVVTAFTLAHSVTLTLATLGVVALPSRLIESLIAASVVLAALNNVFPLVQRRLWVVAFAFGLVHGLGFATVLAELGLPRHALIVSLVAFNLGVELGQLAIVALLLPFIFFLRETSLYPRLLLRAGSSAIAALGGLWLVERAFDLRLL
ncbi:MAG: HupE/UreJ family protein [Geminicoccaceae bacterium]